MATCEELIKAYLAWFGGQFEVNKDGEACRITTPYLSPDGDYIDVLVSQDPTGKYILSDDGAVSDFLYLSGIDLESRNLNRRNLFETILNKNGVAFDNGLLRIDSSSSAFGPAFQQLVRAIQEAQSLVFSAKETGARTFREEVTSGFNDKGIGYSANIILPGLAKAEHRFDFGRQVRGEQLIIHTLSTANPAYASTLAVQLTWSFLDVRAAKQQFRGISVIDDSEDVWKGEALTILKAYCDDVVPWSESERLWKLVA